MLEILLLVLSVCIDSLVASIAYGTNKIKIPLTSAFVISFICSLFLGASIFLGSLIKNIMPNNICNYLSFFILFFIGIYHLFGSIFKSFLQKRISIDKPYKFKLFDMNFILQVYADETKADFDKSNTLSLKESIYLAIALSFDSLAIGFGSSLAMNNYISVVFLSFIIGFLFVILGVLIGRKLVEKSNVNLSWLTGTILIILAFVRL